MPVFWWERINEHAETYVINEHVGNNSWKLLKFLFFTLQKTGKIVENYLINEHYGKKILNC